jgi:allophanate hydrolase
MGRAVLAPGDSLDLAALGARYREGTLAPSRLVEAILARIAKRGEDGVWIRVLPPDELMGIARGLEAKGPARLPLYGIPFAIKDNIDLARHPTTAGCREFAYTPAASAPVVARLVAAGAIPVGKCNLDQFATGLNGTR